MKNLILIAVVLNLVGCASVMSQKDLEIKQHQIEYAQNMEEQDEQLAINLKERELRNKQEQSYKDWEMEQDKIRTAELQKQEAEQFSYNIGRGLGITSKCEQARMTNASYYARFKERTLADAKKNPNYDAKKVQAGYEEGVRLGSVLMHTNPYMMLQGCSQMNAAVEADREVGSFE